MTSVPTPKEEARRTQMRFILCPSSGLMIRPVICQPTAVAMIRYKKDSIVLFSNLMIRNLDRVHTKRPPYFEVSGTICQVGMKCVFASGE